MIEGLRKAIIGGDESRIGSLVDLSSEQRVLDAINELKGRDCIWAYSYNPFKCVFLDHQGLVFSNGVINRTCGRSFFKEHGFGWGIEVLYDVVAKIDLEQASFVDKSLKDLKVYKFTDSAGNESETAEVIHFNAFAAYQSAIPKLKGGRSNLQSSTNNLLGRVFYWHEHFRD